MREKIYVTPELYNAMQALEGGIIEREDPILDALDEIDKALLSPDGKEVHNRNRMVHHTGLNRPHTLQEQIKRLVNVELSRQMAAQGQETFEEAEDFDIEDENDPFDNSPYEVIEMQPEQPINVETTPSPDQGAVADPEPVNPQPAQEGVTDAEKTTPTA